MSGARPRHGATLALLLCLSALAGCTDDSEPADPDPDRTAADGMTAPGAELEMGEKATVTVGEDGAVIELTVRSVAKGDPEDLRTLEGTPFYVRLEATAVSGDAYDFVVDKYVSGWVGGERVGPMANPLSLAPSCEKRFFRPNPPPSTTLNTCVTMVVPPGIDEIDHIAFENGLAYRVVDDTDIQWE